MEEQTRLYVKGTGKEPIEAIEAIGEYRGYAFGQHEYLQRGEDRWSLFVYVDTASVGKCRVDLMNIPNVESVTEG